MELKEILPKSTDVREYIEDRLAECDNPHKLLDRLEYALDEDSWVGYVTQPTYFYEALDYYTNNRSECDECLENSGLPWGSAEENNLIDVIIMAVALHREEQFREELQRFVSDYVALIKESEK